MSPVSREIINSPEPLELSVSPKLWEEIERRVAEQSTVHPDEILDDGEEERFSKVGSDEKPTREQATTAIIEALQEKNFLSLTPDTRTGKFQVHATPIPRAKLKEIPRANPPVPPSVRSSLGKRALETVVEVALETEHTIQHSAVNAVEISAQVTQGIGRTISGHNRRQKKQASIQAEASARERQAWEAQRSTKLTLQYSKEELAAARQASRNVPDANMLDPDSVIEFDLLREEIKAELTKRLKTHLENGGDRAEFRSKIAEIRNEIVRNHLGRGATDEEITRFLTQFAIFIKQK